MMRKFTITVVLVALALCATVQAQTAQIDALRERAEQGDAAAQYELGLGYKLGERVPQDAVEAARWYRLAAEQGYASAQYGLGSAYYSGDGQRHRVSSQNLEPQSTDLSRTRLLTA